MRWWWLVVVLLVPLGGFVLVRTVWWRAVEIARPLAVPGDDHEVAWLHTSTSGESWEDFVWGLKRTEMAGSGAPAGLRVDDSAAFPDRTTEIPEVVVSRDGYEGRLRFRWYKVTNYAPAHAWVKALAERDRAPLAIIGGWSSDRARELAEALRDQPWPGERPLFLIATATADSVYPDEDNYAAGYKEPPKLIGLYDRAFRFCFTNRQMAEAVTDFVLTDPGLRPGPAVLPGLRAVPGAVGGGWAALTWLAELSAPPPGVAPLPDVRAAGPGLPAFAVAWKDAPYSLDLCQQFREVLAAQGAPRPPAGGDRVHGPAVQRRPVLPPEPVRGPGGRSHPGEPAAARRADARGAADRDRAGPPGAQRPGPGEPRRARRLVAITGDGIPVNALFRDGEFAWPVRAIPVPLVLFTHTDPLDWDEPGSTCPRPGTRSTPAETRRREEQHRGHPPVHHARRRPRPRARSPTGPTGPRAPPAAWCPARTRWPTGSGRSTRRSSTRRATGSPGPASSSWCCGRRRGWRGC
ncbi:hypothetical protein [Frigoriglobus tundricola]|uniref:Uncharacterized protein n=1 Tax=Frigoriglobus tundricola TaxID=2774151 RepID=A0A6M5YQU4_9BACT|nr:hypothetical protein [Frigoriglobus tundricola]QJW95362.1 hypothetical protein FTUN_2910 [Frigoriglobus tundricola]